MASAVAPASPALPWAISTPRTGAAKENILTDLGQLNLMKDTMFRHTYKTHCAFIYTHDDDLIKPVLKGKKVKLLKALMNDLTDVAADIAHETLTPGPRGNATKDILIDRIIFLGRIICTSMGNDNDKDNEKQSNLSLATNAYVNGDISLAERHLHTAVRNTPDTPTIIDISDTEPQPNTLLVTIIKDLLEKEMSLMRNELATFKTELATVRIRLVTSNDELATLKTELATATTRLVTSDSVTDKMKSEIKALNEWALAPFRPFEVKGMANLEKMFITQAVITTPPEAATEALTPLNPDASPPNFVAQLPLLTKEVTPAAAASLTPTTNRAKWLLATTILPLPPATAAATRTPTVLPPPPAAPTLTPIHSTVAQTHATRPATGSIYLGNIVTNHSEEELQQFIHDNVSVEKENIVVHRIRTIGNIKTFKVTVPQNLVADTLKIWNKGIKAELWQTRGPRNQTISQRQFNGNKNTNQTFLAYASSREKSQHNIQYNQRQAPNRGDPNDHRQNRQHQDPCRGSPQDNRDYYYHQHQHNNRWRPQTPMYQPYNHC